MGLRPYQQECLDNVRDKFRAGVTKQLCVAPTASGKTIVFSHLPESIEQKPGEQIILLVHRDELVQQSQAKLQQYNPDLKVEVEKAEQRASRGADIIVASVASIGRLARKKGQQQDDLFSDEDEILEFSPRLLKFDPERMKALIIDECHHAGGAGSAASGNIYHNVIKYFRRFKPDPAWDGSGKLLIGFTATPNRSDNVGLESIFDEITFKRDIREMIEAGWLTDIRAYRVQTEVSLAGVKTTAGDFATKDLEERVNTPDRNNLIVDKYIQLGEGMTGVVFTVDIKHSDDIAEAFRERGIPAAAVSSKTPKDERKAILSAHASGEIKIVSSCGVLSEGWDCPTAVVGIMARPTKSSLLYTQQVGRILRPYPAPEQRAGWQGWVKNYAILIDMADTSVRHRLVTIPTLFGVKPEFNFKGRLLTEAVAEVEELQKKAKGAIQESLYSDVDSLRGMVEMIDLFAKPIIPDEVKRWSQFAWVTGMAAGFTLVLPEKESLTVRENALGQFDVFQSINGSRTCLKTIADLQAAFRFADSLVPREAQILVKQAAAWRLGEASPKQIKYLGILYPEMRREFRDEQAFVTAMMARYSKGDVSVLLNQRTQRGEYLKRP